jgi:membrane-associated phospholipid phosphatase
VTFSVLAIFALAKLKLQTRWLLPMQIWFGLICVSTLLVYQHVLLDLVSGVTIGALVFLIVWNVFNRSSNN